MGCLDQEIGEIGVESPNQYDLQEQPQEVGPHRKMPQLFDAEGHQQAAARQEKGADTHKSHGSNKTAVGAQLEPRGVGKRSVGRQKHQSEQHGYDHVLCLAEGVGQAFRDLCDELLADLHDTKMDCKDKENNGLLRHSVPRNDAELITSQTKLVSKPLCMA